MATPRSAARSLSLQTMRLISPALEIIPVVDSMSLMPASLRPTTTQAPTMVAVTPTSQLMITLPSPLQLLLMIMHGLPLPLFLRVVVMAGNRRSPNWPAAADHLIFMLCFSPHERNIFAADQEWLRISLACQIAFLVSDRLFY